MMDEYSTQQHYYVLKLLSKLLCVRVCEKAANGYVCGCTCVVSYTVIPSQVPVGKLYVYVCV